MNETFILKENTGTQGRKQSVTDFRTVYNFNDAHEKSQDYCYDVYMFYEFLFSKIFLFLKYI